MNIKVHYREWTCEECTNGLVQIATIFVQQEYIDDIISFLQVVMMTITIMMMMIHTLFVNHAHPRYVTNMKVLEMMIMKAMVVTMRGLMTAVMVMVRRVLIKTLVGRSLLRSSCRPSYLSWGFCSNDDVAPCLLAESCFGSWFCFHIYQNGDVVSFLL